MMKITIKTILASVLLFAGCSENVVKINSENALAGEVSVRSGASFDICVYGGTSAGILAAYTAKLQGKKVLMIEPSRRIGGLTTGGLGHTDVGKSEAIKGYALDFYKKVGQIYGMDGPAYDFTPGVALTVYNEMVQDLGLDILYGYRINSAEKKGNVVKSITLESSMGESPNITVFAKVFIDCSYEGDLMARSGISYTCGREANSAYGETFNGVQMLNGHQFPDGVDPYKIKGDPSSGLLYGISDGDLEPKGSGDNKIQAYNFRITLTNDPANMIPITRPENYDPAMYELMIRLKEVSPWKSLNDVFIWSRMPGGKTDINNRNGFSTDMIGENWAYPEASYEERDAIFKKHLDYTKGLLYFVGHDPRIPENIREEMLTWGYPKDEYLDSEHFTPQLYIRESRRMVGRLVMTQAHCQSRVTVDDPVGLASYTMDSHNCQRIVIIKDGRAMVKNEGNVEEQIYAPYPVSYRAITPKEEDAVNVIVPVCLSASHIAYGSIRMEPVFMILGETSALAACQAIDKHHNCVQKVDTEAVMNLFNSLSSN